jgi:MraZ protein
VVDFIEIQSVARWPCLVFLLKWKQVQLSGEKCFSGFSAVFQGASSLSLDAKGRLSVPTRHREVLSATAAGRLTITKHPHGCLMLFPRNEWEKFRDRIAALPMQAQWWKRIFLGNAMDVEMDGTGRVLVSPELRAAVDIRKDTILLGMGAYFELWDAQRYAAQEAEAMKGDMPDVFKDFSF